MTDPLNDLERLREDVRELRRLRTETANEHTADLDRLDARAIMERIHAEDRTVPDAVHAAVPELTDVAEAAVRAIEGGGRLVYVGAGTSGRLGVLDAAECPPTYGVPPTMVVGLIAGGDKALKVAQEGAEDDEEQAIRDMDEAGIDGRDAVLGITARGRTPWVRAILREAKRRGAWTGLLTCNPIEKAPELDTLAVLDVGPEVVAGSTRMKAGLGTKMALTMISTTTMVRLGKVKGNRMVDLMPNSAKLRARQVRMIMDELGVELEEAARRLQSTGGDLRRALEKGR